MTRYAVPAAVVLALAGSLALAQTESQGTEGATDMSNMDMSSMMSSADPAMQDLMAPMQTLMQNMPMESAGDIDADFIRMMIPHHQSAIDMARVELEQGDDEETRAMAQQIIDAQEQEIEQLHAMLERMGVEAPAAPAE